MTKRYEVTALKPGKMAVVVLDIDCGWLAISLAQEIDDSEGLDWQESAAVELKPDETAAWRARWIEETP